MIWCGLLLLTSVSCATTQKSSSLVTVQKNSNQRSDASGTGSITWISKDKNVAAPAVLLVSWPDKLRLEIQDPIGGVLALLVINGENFWWYASDQKEILTGKAGKMKEAVGIPFEAQDLVRAFLGRPGVEKWADAKLLGNSAKLETPLWEEELQWSDRLNEPTLWRRVFKTGARVQVLFEDYNVRFGASYPSKVRIESLQKDRRDLTISWVWNDWQPRVPSEKKLFQIPQEQVFGRKIKALP